MTVKQLLENIITKSNLDNLTNEDLIQWKEKLGITIFVEDYSKPIKRSPLSRSALNDNYTSHKSSNVTIITTRIRMNEEIRHKRPTMSPRMRQSSPRMILSKL